MKVLSLVIMAMLSSLAMMATPINGTLNFTGNAQLSLNSIDFQCDLLGVCGAGYGDFFVTGHTGQSGVFASASILDHFGNVLSVSGQPLDTPISISDFVLFAGEPDVVLDLTRVFSGVGGPCPPSSASVCSPTGSPLNISKTPTGSIATFSVLANARRISTGEITPYQGLFTLQFVKPPSELLTSLSTTTVSTSYSSTFSPFNPVPEPEFGGLIGSVLLGLAFLKKAK